VPATAIIELHDVRTTRDEAQESAAELGRRDLRHVLLVTESLHMKRAKLVFEAAGLTISPASSDNFPSVAKSADERFLLLKRVVVHSFGLLYYGLAGFI
jgi:uncharacterized SAM-binding protein YcdF (DUF218 family)